MINNDFKTLGILIVYNLNCVFLKCQNIMKLIIYFEIAKFNNFIFFQDYYFFMRYHFVM